jgi:uncharacterized protein YjbI with pentapeptide repeats
MEEQRRELSSEPEGYVPPRSSEELVRRYAAGERYFHRAHLTKASLPEAILAGADLTEANLAGANLCKARLTGVNLSGANLVHANLRHADLTMTVDLLFSDAHVVGARASLLGADLSSADLREARLDGVSLVGARLSDARLEGAILLSADLTDADLSGAKLHGASLQHARCVRASLWGADLTHARLRDASFEGADLREVRGAHFDSTFLRSARLLGSPSDSWSVLRRRYTGTLFALHLLLFCAFLMPYVGRAIFWVTISHTQEIAVKITNRMMHEVSPRLEEAGERWAVWKLLLGVDRGWFHVLPALVLILYNVCRGILTVRVSMLRDQEERSGYTPSSSEYAWLIWLHRVGLGLLAMAIATLTVHLYAWLSAEVWLPK